MPTRRPARAAAFIVCAFWLGASSCSFFNSCTGAGAAGLHLTLVDGTTGAGPVSEITVVAARQGEASADTMRLAPSPSQPVTLPFIERPGVYTLTIIGAGYATVERPHEELRWDSDCDTMETRRITVTLTRVS